MSSGGAAGFSSADTTALETHSYYQGTEYHTEQVDPSAYRPLPAACVLDARGERHGFVLTAAGS